MNKFSAANSCVVENTDSRQQLLEQISALGNRLQTGMNALCGEITWKQAQTLACIRLCGGCPTVRELSDCMGSSHQNVKQLLLKLEKKGLVRISPDPLDRRKQRISLTDTCGKLCSGSAAAGQTPLPALFRGISPEMLTETARVLGIIDKNLEKIRQKPV